MAISLTQAQLSAAIRLGDSPEEVAESTRLLAYVTAAISTHLADAYEDAPEAVVNEAAIRLAGYLFDQPNAGRGLSFANAGRNSGAWAILLPFRLHRAGSTGEAVAAAQEAVGTTGNPVAGLAITVDGKLEVIFADGATVELDLPAGMGGGVLDQTARDAAAAAQADVDAHELAPHNTDTVARNAAATAQGTADGAQTTADAVRTELTTHETTPHGGGGGTDQMARDAAAAAQVAADGAQSDLDAHEGSTHNTDATARDAAQNARTTAEQSQAAIDAHAASIHNTDGPARTAAATAQGAAVTAQADLATHEAAPHNTDGAARTAAADAQSAIDDHERTPHNTDGAARTAAAAAQARADDSYTLADEKVDANGAAAAARASNVGLGGVR